MNKRERGNNKFLTVVVILLIITICILLLLLLRPIRKVRIPTGRVDEFDIQINGVCKNRNDDSCFGGGDDDGSQDASSDRGVYYAEEKKINGKTDTDIDREGIVYVDDKNGRYVYQRSLKIFENPAFEYTNKIAPGVSNSYNFRVHNETEASIIYGVEFSESSDYPINMRYRLRRNGNYIIGSDYEWVGASELVSALKVLEMDAVDSYTLDWEWPYESDRDLLDTEIGENMSSEYALEIKIKFEEL